MHFVSHLCVDALKKHAEETLSITLACDIHQEKWNIIKEVVKSLEHILTLIKICIKSFEKEEESII